MTPRPDTPEIRRGDVMLAGRTEVRVTGAGPKYISVIASELYEAFVAEPSSNRWRVRRFLREDMGEGERGGRVGSTARLRTREQAYYDAVTEDAERFIRGRAGLTIERDSPYRDRDMMVGLAAILRELLPEPEAADDA